MKVEIAYKLTIAANSRRGRGGFAASGRAAKERRIAMLAVIASDDAPPALPVRVTLTRIGPGAPDWDNVVGAFKHVRDGVADALGVRDNDPRVSWEYASRKGAPKQYAIEIRVEARA